MENRQKLVHISEILRKVLVNDTCPKDEFPNPPFDSPIEQIFAESCFKYFSHDVQVDKQVEIRSKHGIFRLDFLIQKDSKRIAIECDGKDFHDTLKDEIRDSILLGENHCDIVYHFRGSDLVYYPLDCIWLITVLDEYLFNERGLIQLQRLRSYKGMIDKDSIEKNEDFCLSINPPNFIWIFRISTELPMKNPSLNYHWVHLYKFCCNYPSLSLDELFETRISIVENSICND